MTAKILATLGALGIILTIWAADFRYLWTGIILLVISVGIAAHKNSKRKEQDHIKFLRAENRKLKEDLSIFTSNPEHPGLNDDPRSSK